MMGLLEDTKVLASQPGDQVPQHPVTVQKLHDCKASARQFIGLSVNTYDHFDAPGSRRRQPSIWKSVRRTSLLCVTFIMQILCTGLALAQAPADGTAPPVPNWLVQCADASDGNAPRCNMSQSVVLVATGERILTVAVQPPDEQGLPAMMVTLPLGLYLPAGVRMLVDAQEFDALVVQTCEASGCYAGLKADRALLAAMQRGFELKFVVQDLQQRNIDLTLTLMGFSKSFADLQSR